MTANVHPAPQPFSKADYKTPSLAALGGALEIYDFIIFVFFALTLSQLFFPPDMPEWLRLLQSFGIFVTGYLARPLGGILMAHFADRLGRKKVFSLSILMMALPCLLIGIMPTYAQIGYWAPLVLLVLRILQGAAVGGEVPSAWVFVAEHAPKGHRGYALGVLQAGLTFGYLLGALTATWLARAFSPAEILDWAWRIPFLLGGVFGVVGVWLRRWLNETPVFIAMHAQRENLPALPLGKVLREHRQSLLPAVLLTFVLTSAVVVLVVITPTVMQQRFGISASHTFALSALGIVFLNVGCVLAGLLVDRIGAWRGVMFYSLLLPLGIGVLYTSLIAVAAAWHRLRHCRAGLRDRRRGAFGDGRTVPGEHPRVRHLIDLQYRLRFLGQYHSAAADRADALEYLGLCALQPDHGHRGPDDRCGIRSAPGRGGG
ncbi:major facilitator transporter [Pseudomonas syringae pv. persicae]|uniref:Major facilitator transporter n=1 Tax=Pseudomonas syringae pv. persicae TaxID=237306 RepID=A0AB38EAP2_9PSED|nr:major facilitator transporter [Pseudomonas syringae pv. persicae]SOQ07629.1 major facilitator transporter [Pseudomonas syringae pv. persicae]